ncbi:MAG: T9SS type A sorting domain-containing protein [Flavobacteriales bacterium]|jgi:hypothetical protein|nr:T9SS type A sorting domain-containing protein [Flavobacteriales bacterium]
MKKIFTLLFTIGLASVASAQIGIYIEDEATDVSGTIVDLAGGESIHENFDVINEGDAALTLRCTRVKLQTVDGATDYLCWGKDLVSGICYPSSTVGPNDPWTTPDEYVWEPGDDGLLSVYHVANGNVGVAMYRYYIIDNSDNLLDSVDVRFTSTVGIDQTENAEFNSYPNPTSDVFNIQMSNNAQGDNYTVALYNIVGEKVMDVTLTEGTNKLDVSSLVNGVYFYSIYKNQDVIETKKVVVRK